MPHEHLIILTAIIAAYAAKRENGIFAAISRLYVAAFYALSLSGLASPEILRAVSRYGFLLIFAADIFPLIVDYIKRRAVI